MSLAACGADPVEPAGLPVAATSDPGDTQAPAVTPAVRAPTAAPPAPPVTPAATAPAESLTLAFVGDINFESEIRARLDADPASVFGPAAQELAAADLTFGNLETAIAESGAPEPKTYTFRAPPTAFEALELAGFDAVSMANNHGVDYGAEGLEDSLAAIAQTDVAVAGIGASAAEAYAPVFLEAKGRRVAFLAALQLQDQTWSNWGATDSSGGVARYDDRFVESVRTADAQADVTIAYLHWGPENEACPHADVAPPIVDELIEAGADIVVGAHAHMLQGAGWRDRVFVSYGLGNYLWYFQRNEQTTRTGIFTVTVEGNDAVSLDYSPARIQTPSGIPLPMTGDEAAAAQVELEELRACTDLSAAPPSGG